MLLAHPHHGYPSLVTCTNVFLFLIPVDAHIVDNKCESLVPLVQELDALVNEFHTLQLTEGFLKFLMRLYEEVLAEEIQPFALCFGVQLLIEHEF